MDLGPTIFFGTNCSNSSVSVTSRLHHKAFSFSRIQPLHLVSTTSASTMQLEAQSDGYADIIVVFTVAQGLFCTQLVSLFDEHPSLYRTRKQRCF